MNQAVQKFRPHWGEFGAAAQLPNVAGATIQNSNLSRGDIAYSGTTLYVCTTATRGAAVWAAIGSGGGGGLPTFDMLTGFTAGNRYDAAGNGLPGVATGFIVAALVEMTELNGGQSVLSNINFGVDGWQINIEANGAFQGSVIDTAGGVISVTGPVAVALTDPIGSHPVPKHWLIVMEVLQNGANNDVALWINGQKLDTGVGTSPYAPRTGAPAVGTGAFGNVAEFTGISGFAYIEGTRTDDQIREWTFDVLAAADMVDDVATGFAVYSVKRGAPAATWLASDGAALTFNRVGALTTVNRPVPFFG